MLFKNNGKFEHQFDEFAISVNFQFVNDRIECASPKLE